MATHKMEKPPRCIVIAGPNGSGKTTFAREYLAKEAGVVHFVNADLIAYRSPGWTFLLNQRLAVLFIVIG